MTCFAAALRWRYLVVDEGHRLKNASCRLSTKLRAFKADGRLLLTGASSNCRICSELDNDVSSMCTAEVAGEHGLSCHRAGTPLHNGVEDLWSLLNFLMPDLFGSENTFMQWCVLPINTTD